MSPMSSSSTDEWDDSPKKEKEEDKIDYDAFETEDNETSRYLYEMMEFNPQKYPKEADQQPNNDDQSKESQKQMEGSEESKNEQNRQDNIVNGKINFEKLEKQLQEMKERGNAQFNRKSYIHAIKIFSQAIHLYKQANANS